MRKSIVIQIQFNTTRQANMTRRLSKAWIEHRIRIFMNYTLQSLINQTNQSYLCIINYDPATEELVKGELAKYDDLPSNIMFTDQGDEIIHPYIKDSDVLYLVRLDCDDIYHPTFVQQLVDYNHKEDTQILINQKGFVYDILNDKLGDWFVLSSPFFVSIYDVDKYINGERYVLKGGHMGAILLKHEIINHDNYVVTVHDKNTLNTFDRHSKRVIEGSEKELIMKEFYIRKKEEMI